MHAPVRAERWRFLLLITPLLAPLAAANGALKFDIDDPPQPDHQLASNLFGGAKLVVESEFLKQFDPDRDAEDQRASAEPQFEAALAWVPHEDVHLIGEFELKKKFWFDHPDGRDEDDTKLELKEFYLLLRELQPGWSLQLGRQRYRDEREWLYDEELDGVRLIYRQAEWGIELSANREEAFKKDLLSTEREDPIDNYEIRWRHGVLEDAVADIYLFVRDDREPGGEDLNFLGVHSSGKAASHHYYWLEAAVVEGERRGRDILGYGVDLGWTYRFSGAQRHNLTLGLAYGSGDSSGRGTDNNFRQTDLQDNNARLQGLSKIKIYGEVLDPELSNLTIATLGWGMRPTPDSSIDLLYHRYHQVEADDRLRDSALVADPNGDSNDIGQELDLMWAAKLTDDVKLSWVVGRFRTGEAFDHSDRIWFTELTYNLRF